VTRVGIRSPARRTSWPLIVIGWTVAGLGLARGIGGTLDPLDAIALVGAGASFAAYPNLRGRWYWEGYTDGWVDASNPKPVATERPLSPSARAAGLLAARIARPFTR
jgi:hypothetical protein